jgi:hypothetical protein
MIIPTFKNVKLKLLVNEMKNTLDTYISQQVHVFTLNREFVGSLLYMAYFITKYGVKKNATAFELP